MSLLRNPKCWRWSEWEHFAPDPSAAARHSWHSQCRDRLRRNLPENPWYWSSGIVQIVWIVEYCESLIVDRDMNGHRGAKIHSCKWDVSSSSYMFQSLSRIVFSKAKPTKGPKMAPKSKQKRSHSRSFQVLSYWWSVLDRGLLKTPIVLPLFSFLTPYLALTLCPEVYI